MDGVVGKAEERTGGSPGVSRQHGFTHPAVESPVLRSYREVLARGCGSAAQREKARRDAVVCRRRHRVGAHSRILRGNRVLRWDSRLGAAPSFSIFRVLPAPGHGFAPVRFLLTAVPRSGWAYPLVFPTELDSTRPPGANWPAVTAANCAMMALELAKPAVFCAPVMNRGTSARPTTARSSLRFIHPYPSTGHYLSRVYTDCASVSSATARNTIN